MYRFICGFLNWFAGPEIYTKAEVRRIIREEKLYYGSHFKIQIQLIKNKIADLEAICQRVNKLEAGLLPKRDAKGHFMKKDDQIRVECSLIDVTD